MFRNNSDVVPSLLLPLFTVAAKHRDPVRRFRLYAVLAKFQRHGEEILHGRDEDVRAVRVMARQVDREIKRVLKSVRFHSHVVDTAQFLEAWVEPKHVVLQDIGEFFAKHLPNVRWTVRTPDGAASWDLKRLTIVPGPMMKDALSDAPQHDFIAVA